MNSPLLRPLEAVQDRIASLLGCGSDKRPGVVAGMLRRDPSEATSYWLQLVVSVGIATMGLVLGSTAVVIGAMLVAPLMGPILGLGMGLATGSPFLVLRSAGRVLLSVVTAVASSALLTKLLPFHELNAEIAARASPTALDLLTAAFCALAGVYAALRPGSDTAATAAGTSIGISLVPPLCASGFGFGTVEHRVALGAALLFLTNFVAIVVVATVAFLAVGFQQVRVAQLEKEELATSSAAPIASAIAKRLAWVFRSRVGAVTRVLMPFLLLAAVYVPLRRALNEVAWEVRVRQGVTAAVARVELPRVQTRIRVERHTVDVAVVLVGSNAEAASARAQLEGEVRQLAGIEPRIEILAVPDATAFAGLESTLQRPVPAPAPAPPPPPDPAKVLADSRVFADAAIRRAWPAGAAGEPLAVSIATSGTPLRVRVVHMGSPLESAAREALGRALARDLGGEVVLTDEALPSGEVTRSAGDAEFLASVGRILGTLEQVEGLSLCVVAPKPATYGPEKAFDASLGAMLAGRRIVSTVEGASWSMRVVAGACAPAARPAAEHAR